MAHSANVISKVNIGGTLYEIHDTEAIHSIQDLENLGFDGALVFKGAVASRTNLPTTGNKAGDVYHIIDEDQEVVYIEVSGVGQWEDFGHKIVTEHTHNVSGNLTVTGHNNASSVSGTATVTGSNGSSSVSGSGSVSVPKVTKAANYIKATSSIGNVAVGANGTANAITGFGNHTTAAAITALNTGSVNSASASDVSIPNVTGNTTVTASKISDNTTVTASKVGVTAGSAASWSASVTDGVLSFNFSANTPTAVTATDVTASKITASDVSASKVTLGTALSASKVTTSPVTVVTGSKSTANAITALGTPTTAAALTGVQVTTQPTLSVSLEEATSTDGVLVGDTVAISSENKTVNITGTAAAQTWTQGTGTISGTAAAQTWTKDTASINLNTGLPIEA